MKRPQAAAALGTEAVPGPGVRLMTGTARGGPPVVAYITDSTALGKVFAGLVVEGLVEDTEQAHRVFSVDVA